MSPRWALDYADSAFETLLDGSIWLTLAKLTLRLGMLVSVICSQREAGSRDSTGTCSAAWCSKVTWCSWLLISFLVLWCTQLLKETLLLSATTRAEISNVISYWISLVFVYCLECCLKMETPSDGVGLWVLTLYIHRMPKKLSISIDPLCELLLMSIRGYHLHNI